MLSPILCCYRGCQTTVWAPSSAGGGLAVRCSSATCMQCRRVALCLPHFRDVFERQRDLACPNCRGRRWFLRAMRGDRVSAALKVAVEASGGRIEVDDVRAPAEASQASRWRWLRVDQLPSDARILDRGVLARADRRGAAIIVDGRPLEWISPSMPRSASRASPTAADLIVSDEDGSQLSWVGPDGLRLSLRAPDGCTFDRPTFIDGRRLVYVSRDGEGHTALWEGTIEPPGRVRQRRVCALGRGRRPQLAPVAVRRLEAVVALSSDGDVCAPTWIRLSDGQSSPLAGFEPTPRALVGARRAPYAVWIDHTGAVRCAGLHHPLQTLGQAVGDLLAITDDGRSVAWCTSETEITTCEVRSGAVERQRVRGRLVWLGAASS